MKPYILLAIVFSFFFSSPGLPGTIFNEGFETSQANQIPQGWEVEYSSTGQEVFASESRANEGNLSLFITKTASIKNNSIEQVDTSSGTFGVTFYMYVDTSLWQGQDGDSRMQINFNGKMVQFGLRKVDGEFRALVIDDEHHTFQVAGLSDGWVRFCANINATDWACEFFINGASIYQTLQSGFKTLGTRLAVVSGNTSSGGTPAAYYDSISVITPAGDCEYTPCQIIDSDSDGVIDQWDECADTPMGSAVFANGCPASTAGGECAVLQQDLDINLPCIDVFGNRMSVELIRYVDPENPSSLYWQYVPSD